MEGIVVLRRDSATKNVQSIENPSTARAETRLYGVELVAKLTLTREDAISGEVRLVVERFRPHRVFMN